MNTVAYNVTYKFVVPASVYGKAINRVEKMLNVSKENIGKIPNIIKIEEIRKITVDDVTQDGKFGCE
jgi:hypothetical protein